MNQHLNDGQLRAALDGELDAQALGHLSVCPECRRRQSEMRAQSHRVARRLAFLSSAADKTPSAQSALKRFRDRKLSQKEIPMLKRIFASTSVRYAAIAVLVLAVIIAVPATRALADQVLNLFRVEQVTVLPVDLTGMKQLNGDGPLGQQLSDLVSGSVSVKQKPGAPVSVADAAGASEKAGFAVRLPGSEKFSRLVIQKAAAYDFTIEQTKAQALLDEAGRSDLVLPKDIDGAVISVHVPASVRADFGSCPDPAAAESTGHGSLSREYANCVILLEMPSPTVDAPANVDVAQLAEIGLEFTGMTKEQAQAYTKTIDWTSTLVVPIPKNAATYEQVAVDGVTGTLVQRPSDDAANFVLIWVKNGIIYSIGGLGSDSQRAIAIANSLK
jgi:hypothetical protein